MKEKLHIIPHKHNVSKANRNVLFNHSSFVIWFTGLSGSGKSTLANGLENLLHSKGVATYILDGDNVRAGLNKDLDFSEKGRIENIRRIGEVANLFIDSGVVVLSAFVSPFRMDRQTVKSLVGAENFIEVFVDCPIEICEQRDVKGLYQKARNGEISNFTGISSPFEIPTEFDVRIPTNEMSIEEGLQILYDKIRTKLDLKK